MDREVEEAKTEVNNITKEEEGGGGARAIVLLSGGLDSAVALWWIGGHVRDPSHILAVSFDYGQRHKKEIEHAMALSAHFGCDHTILETTVARSLLTDPSQEVPKVSYGDIEGVSPAYVPFRNGTMLSRAASEAHGRDYDAIVTAVHAEDSQDWAYADCTPEFMGAMANAIYVGTYGNVRLMVPFQHMTKTSIVILGTQMGVPFEKTWSCYEGGRYHCGVCPTCRARKEAFRIAGIEDPTFYLDEAE